MDWSIINERFSLGGRPDTEGVTGLMRHGHTHIIDLRHTTTNTDLYWMNFVYLRNPTFDDGGEKSVEWFTRSIAFAWGALLNPSSRIYIGCHSGLHRAPSTLYAILRTQGMSSEDACQLLSVKRPGVFLRYMADAEVALKALGYS
jgi:hypothetical protein